MSNNWLTPAEGRLDELFDLDNGVDIRDLILYLERIYDSSASSDVRIKIQQSWDYPEIYINTGETN